MPLLCVGHDNVSFISLFAVCHYFHFPGASRSLCFTLTCLSILHRVFAHHADFKEAPGCNHKPCSLDDTDTLPSPLLW